MKKLYPSDKIYVGKSHVAKNERGVFAKRAIKKNELIETCPVIEVSKQDAKNLRESILITYFYYFGKKKERFVTALGFGSLYNHTYSPNAVYSVNHKTQVLQFKAIRDIKKDEEITVNYIFAYPNAKSPLWFENA